MKGKGVVFVAIVAALLSFSAGCIVEERSGRGYGRHETYYYYPDDEVYFYPNVRQYYWLDRGAWSHGPQPPRRYILEQRRRVKLDLDYEPHTQHAKIRNSHPARDRDRDKDRDRDRDRDRDKDRY